MADEKKVQRWNPVLLANEKATVVTVSGELPFYAGMVDLEDGECVKFTYHAAREAELLARIDELEALAPNWKVQVSGMTHHQDCWKKHPQCALARIAVLERETKIASRAVTHALNGSIDFWERAEREVDAELQAEQEKGNG